MAKLTLTDISAGYDTATINAANNTLVEDALENTLSRDGTSPNQMEANIDMNSNYVRNMHDGVNNQDAVTVAQLNGAVISSGSVTSVTTLTDVGDGTPTAGNVLVGDGDSWESTTFVASYFDAEASTDGYVLTSDGAGNAAWEVVSSGSSFPLDNKEGATWTNASAGTDVGLVLQDDSTLDDASFSSVSLLLPMDGADAATSTTDFSTNNLTVSFFGNAQIDTAQSKYDGSSLLLDGTGDYLTVPDNAGWKFAAGDFTIDLAIRFNSIASTATIIAQWDASLSRRAWTLQWLQSSNELIFYYSTNGSAVTTVNRSWTPSTDTWYQLRVSRVGTSLYLSVDGTQIGATHTIGTDNIHAPTTELTIGAEGNLHTNAVNGWIDEVRITKGVGRSAGNYTAPTTPWPRPRLAGSGFNIGDTDQALYLSGSSLTATAPTTFEDALTITYFGGNPVTLTHVNEQVEWVGAPLHFYSDGTEEAIKIDGGLGAAGVIPMMMVYNCGGVDRTFIGTSEDSDDDETVGWYLDFNYSGITTANNWTVGSSGVDIFQIRANQTCSVYSVDRTAWERVLTTNDAPSEGFTVTTGHTSAWASGSIMQLQGGSSSTINSGATYKFDDNANLTFGTGSDVNIDFDATNFVIAGTGEAQLTGFDNVTIDNARVSPITALSMIGATPGSLLNVNTAQAAFPSDRDVITLPAGTYKMTGSYCMQGGGANRSVGMGFVLTTAVADVFAYRTTAWRDAATTRTTTQSTTRVITTSNTQVTASSTAAAAVIEFDGIVRLTTGGTITPQITFSVAPGGTNTMRPGSYIMFERVGNSTFTNLASSA